eukprot:TRINITY_DN28391_c0_g1_i2.p2 TRINITY_DN28391_c0_g1~~TRINITY_DN28391_c0_g1_i2.p2  ORF type:complete len:233 (+),score=41.53 TRINITY_DN28391_c0_g1_i2:59-700(+)
MAEAPRKAPVFAVIRGHQGVTGVFEAPWGTTRRYVDYVSGVQHKVCKTVPQATEYIKENCDIKDVPVFSIGAMPTAVPTPSPPSPETPPPPLTPAHLATQETTPAARGAPLKPLPQVLFTNEQIATVTTAVLNAAVPFIVATMRRRIRAEVRDILARDAPRTGETTESEDPIRKPEAPKPKRRRTAARSASPVQDRPKDPEDGTAKLPSADPA